MEIVKMYIEHLITLCDIIDEFKEFESNLKQLFSSTVSNNMLYSLMNISQGQKCFNNRKIKKFYQENKKVIDIINKDSKIDSFIWQNYTNKGSADNNLNFFYEYILNNKDKLSNIKSLLAKIRRLNIDSLMFDPNIDFTDYEFQMSKIFKLNFEIYYLDNMEVIPTCLDSTVKYRTTGSNYKINASTTFTEISKYGNTILVNSLLFDEKSLPKELTMETTFNKILELSKEQEINIVKNAVNLSISVDDLIKQLNSTNKVIKNLDNVESKDELLELLLNIRKSVQQLQTMSSEYENSVIEENSSITKEILETEKQLCLQRRDWSSIDFD